MDHDQFKFFCFPEKLPNFILNLVRCFSYVWETEKHKFWLFFSIIIWHSDVRFSVKKFLSLIFNNVFRISIFAK